MAMKKNMLKHSAVEDGVCARESDLPGRKAVGVDREIKASNLRRLRRIEGQFAACSVWLKRIVIAPTFSRRCLLRRRR